MTTMNINGRDVKTNYEPFKTYPLCNGKNKEGWTLQTKKGIYEDELDFLKRLAGYGYTRISLYEVSTYVKRYHEVIAYCK